jgi:hypothetical protein
MEGMTGKVIVVVGLVFGVGFFIYGLSTLIPFLVQLLGS